MQNIRYLSVLKVDNKMLEQTITPTLNERRQMMLNG
jgi:hypothetical protein